MREETTRSTPPPVRFSRVWNDRCLSNVSAVSGISEVEGRRVLPSTEIRPCFCCLPMGWNQALWGCQEFHEHVVTDPHDISVGRRFVDNKPCPAQQPFIHTEYVDNFVALSQDPAESARVAHLVEGRLSRAGLPMHAASSSPETASSLEQTLYSFVKLAFWEYRFHC